MKTNTFLEREDRKRNTSIQEITKQNNRNKVFMEVRKEVGTKKEREKERKKE